MLVTLCACKPATCACKNKPHNLVADKTVKHLCIHLADPDHTNSHCINVCIS